MKGFIEVNILDGPNPTLVNVSQIKLIHKLSDAVSIKLIDTEPLTVRGLTLEEVKEMIRKAMS